MKVYVDELPKSCSYCPCKCFETDTCQLNKGIKCPSDNKIANKCPLKSLADYTKQVRKEVCEEMSKLLIKNIQGEIDSLNAIQKETDLTNISSRIVAYSQCLLIVKNSLEKIQGD